MGVKNLASDPRVEAEDAPVPLCSSEEPTMTAIHGEEDTVQVVVHGVDARISARPSTVHEGKRLACPILAMPERSDLFNSQGRRQQHGGSNEIDRHTSNPKSRDSESCTAVRVVSRNKAFFDQRFILS